MESNNILAKINENKIIFGGLIIILLINISYLSDNLINIFDIPIVKLLIFAIILYISINNLTIGIIVTILILVTLQVISNIKIMNEMNSELKLENFKSINGFNELDGFYQTDNNKSNPFLKINQLDPISNNLNLNLETPEQFYKNMINDGKNLLINTYGYLQ